MSDRAIDRLSTRVARAITNAIRDTVHHILVDEAASNLGVALARYKPTPAASAQAIANLESGRVPGLGTVADWALQFGRGPDVARDRSVLGRIRLSQDKRGLRRLVRRLERDLERSRGRGWQPNEIGTLASLRAALGCDEREES